jgi:hypothetical protein
VSSSYSLILSANFLNAEQLIERRKVASIERRRLAAAAIPISFSTIRSRPFTGAAAILPKRIVQWPAGSPPPQKVLRA